MEEGPTVNITSVTGDRGEKIGNKITRGPPTPEILPQGSTAKAAVFVYYPSIYTGMAAIEREEKRNMLMFNAALPSSHNRPSLPPSHRGLFVIGPVVPGRGGWWEVGS